MNAEELLIKYHRQGVKEKEQTINNEGKRMNVKKLKKNNERETKGNEQTRKKE